MAKQPVHSVAIIGAGISGIVSAAHLLAAGVTVTVFERNKAAGGVWLYDERRPIEPLYPSTKPSKGESPGEDIRGNEKRILEHAPPGPCYQGLTNNVSTPLMRVKLNSWPEGTPDFVSHRVMKEYIQDTSRKCGVDAVTIYGARVVDVRKVTSGHDTTTTTTTSIPTTSTWQVTWSTVYENSVTGTIENRTESLSFDAVIVGSGHYHAPRVPDLPGLVESKTKWPSRIIHSKAYRKPDGFEGKNILLIGGGVSAADIAKELGPVAKDVYQSTRNGSFDLPASLLPENGVRVSEVTHIEILKGHEEFSSSSSSNIKKDLSEDDPLPVTVHLKSGQKLCGIHHIVFCTGYHITIPFLQGYHEDNTAPEDASDTVLVTNGTMIHNLFKDIFYIPDPTLAFVGVPYYTATFTLFEFQAIVVAAIFSGIAQLPVESSMREEYRERVRQHGGSNGRGFHSLKDKEEIYVHDMLTWINRDRACHGLPPVEGHSETWLAAKEVQRERLRQRFAEDGDGHVETPVLPVCV